MADRRKQKRTPHIGIPNAPRPPQPPSAVANDPAPHAGLPPTDRKPAGPPAPPFDPIALLELLAKHKEYRHLTALQKNPLLDAYCGRKVRWRGFVGNINEHKDGSLWLSLDAEAKGAYAPVSCDFDRGYRQRLMTLTPGQPITVVGVIANARVNDLALRDCELEFASTSAPAVPASDSKAVASPPTPPAPAASASDLKAVSTSPPIITHSVQTRWRRFTERAKEIYYALGALHYLIWAIALIGSVLGIGWLVKLNNPHHEPTGNVSDSAGIEKNRDSTPSSSGGSQKTERNRGSAPEDATVTMAQYFKEFEGDGAVPYVVLKRYVGKRVTWDGYFESPGGADRFALHLQPGGGSPFVICNFPVNARDDLLTLRKGCKVRLSGILASDRWLEDCKILAIEEAPSNGMAGSGHKAP